MDDNVTEVASNCKAFNDHGATGATRTQSLGYRFYCENLLIQKAMQQPLWGWGAWGREPA